MLTFDAVLLAGAASARLDGADKPMQVVGGVTLLDRSVAAVTGAERVIVVGPTRTVGGVDVWCREQPPDGGPVAAFAAGLAFVEAPVVLLLACDLPFVAGAVPGLLSSVTTSEVAVLLDADGRVNYLASAWPTAVARAAVARLDRVDGASMRSLLAGVKTIEVADEGGWSTDCDTWQSLEVAESLAAARAKETQHG